MTPAVEPPRQVEEYAARAVDYVKRAVGLELAGFTAHFLGPAAPPLTATRRRHREREQREPVVLPPAEARTSAGAAFTRSLLLFMGACAARHS